MAKWIIHSSHGRPTMATTKITSGDPEGSVGERDTCRRAATSERLAIFCCLIQQLEEEFEQSTPEYKDG